MRFWLFPHIIIWYSRILDALIRDELELYFIDVFVGKNCASKEENQVFALSLIVFFVF